MLSRQASGALKNTCRTFDKEFEVCEGSSSTGRATLCAALAPGGDKESIGRLSGSSKEKVGFG